MLFSLDVAKIPSVFYRCAQGQTVVSLSSYTGCCWNGKDLAILIDSRIIMKARWKNEVTLAMYFLKRIYCRFLKWNKLVKTIWWCRNESFLLEFSRVGLTLAFHFQKREQFQQCSHARTCEFFFVYCRQTVAPQTRKLDASAKLCLWPVLTVSDRSRRVKKEKAHFAFQSVFVYVCATESARNLLGVYSAPWPGLACPPTILWSCCWLGRLKMMRIEDFFFSLCRHTEATLLSAVFTPALFVCVWN